jgi:preprotein translocase subunit YajC
MVFSVIACGGLVGFLAQCAPQGGEGGGGGSAVSSLFMIALIFVIFYFLLIRPQQKKQKQHQNMLGTLKKGDRVVTSGGLYGTVVGVKENVVVLRIAEDVKVEFVKSAVTSIVTKE